MLQEPELLYRTVCDRLSHDDIWDVQQPVVEDGETRVAASSDLGAVTVYDRVDEYAVTYTVDIGPDSYLSPGALPLVRDLLHDSRLTAQGVAVTEDELEQDSYVFAVEGSFDTLPAVEAQLEEVEWVDRNIGGRFLPDYL